jgi:hypothetical protein
MAVGGPTPTETGVEAVAVHYEQTVSIDVEAAAGISCDYEQAVVPPPPPPPAGPPIHPMIRPNSRQITHVVDQTHVNPPNASLRLTRTTQV